MVKRGEGVAPSEGSQEATMEQVASGLHSCFGGQEQEGRLVSCELQDSRPVALTRQALRWRRAPRRPRPSTTPHAKH